MSKETGSIRPSLERFPTRVAGLDTILLGGLFVGGVYMIQGVPGSGKTILANQICFGSLAAGGKAVYLTLLAESHTRLIQQLATLAFFDRTAIPDRIHYVSAFRQLQTGGLNGVLLTAQSEVAARSATVLVIDGISVAAEAAETVQEMKRLVHDLQALASIHGCTIFLLTSGDGSLVRAEDTMVDGRIFLEADLLGPQPERRISIMKSRGGDALSGSHGFVIDHSGVRIYPRLETIFREPPSIDQDARAIASGIPGLDSMLEVGGLPIGSCTVIAGPSGSGKTSIALQFLSACSAEEPALGLSFYESPDRMLHKADALGLGLRAAIERDWAKLLWRPPGDYLLDELGYSILAEVEKCSVRRFAIDGVSGLTGAIGYKGREHRFLACLFNELSRRGVTTLLTQDTGDQSAGFGGSSSGIGLASVAGNVVVLQATQDEKALRRSVSIRKIRDSQFDGALRGFAITNTGVTIDSPSSLAKRRT